MGRKKVNEAKAKVAAFKKQLDEKRNRDRVARERRKIDAALKRVHDQMEHAKHIAGAHAAVISKRIMDAARKHEAALKAKINRAKNDLNRRIQAERKKIENDIRGKIAAAKKQADAFNARIRRDANAIKTQINNRAKAELAKARKNLNEVKKAAANI